MGQETKSNQQADEGFLDELLHDAVAAGRELKALIVEVRGLAGEIEAGKMPRLKRIKRIAPRLAWCDSQFDVICLELTVLVGKAKREGYREGLFSVPINDEPFNSIFSAAMKWKRKHPEENPLELQ